MMTCRRLFRRHTEANQFCDLRTGLQYASLLSVLSAALIRLMLVIDSATARTKKNYLAKTVMSQLIVK